MKLKEGVSQDDMLGIKAVYFEHIDIKDKTGAVVEKDVSGVDFSIDGMHVKATIDPEYITRSDGDLEFPDELYVNALEGMVHLLYGYYKTHEAQTLIAKPKE